MNAQQSGDLIQQNTQGHGEIETAADDHIDGAQGQQPLNVRFGLGIQPGMFEHQGRPFCKDGHETFVVGAEGIRLRTLHINDPNDTVSDLQWNG